MTPEITKELKRIARQNGGLLQPSAVVAAATPEGSVLHPHFDWEESTAAQKWRLHQARNLIRVTVTLVQSRNPETASRAFVSLRSERDSETGGYRVLSSVLRNQDLRAELLRDARAEMEVFQRKYQMLEELSEVFAVMARALRAPAA